ncbi:MAG: TolB family protein [Planctomycetota bacterium]|jgi:TolB protein
MLRAILVAIVLLIVVTGCQMQRPAQIAFSRLSGDYWQIWTIGANGRGARQLTTTPSDKRYPIWGRDGSKLFYRDNNNNAFFVDLITGQENRVLESMGLIGSLISSPIDEQLLVVRFRSEIMDSSDLWLTEIDGENRRILTRQTGLQYDPAWSPDGGKIAYISGHGYQTHELYVMDPDGKNKCRLTNNKALELLPAFSPDGKTIAYVSDITGNYEIWLMNVDGNDNRQLTDSPGIDTRPCWSSDGEKILFVSNRNGSLQLWKMNNDGSNVRQLTKGPASTEPAWRIGFDK